eukprot:TRINITY_DN75920_c0_g1_i1.p1 TRINITY_DN75920_c0_g1~~TRINITY_DN75920_c0_g1_i1.p1  ORF type:complete len:486 (-),score=99.70 TRINITY_DN75920_c0_g1_i1:189-1646(-)
MLAPEGADGHLASVTNVAPPSSTGETAPQPIHETLQQTASPGVALASNVPAAAASATTLAPIRTPFDSDAAFASAVGAEPIAPAVVIQSEPADAVSAIGTATAASGSVAGEGILSDENKTFEPLPDPKPAGSGLLALGKMAVSNVAGKVSEMETVQRGVQFVAEKSRAVAESEKVQQGVAFVQKKTCELSESDRIKKGRELAGASIEAAKQTAATVGLKAQEGIDIAKEKTHQGIEYAKDKTRSVREGAGNIWETGRGSISRVRANVGSMAWKGSAKETLNISAQAEQWKDIKVNGAEELNVPARKEHTCCFHVAKGSTLRWTFAVKDHDIGFGVRIRVQEFGGSREEEVLAIERYDNSDTVSGSWVADENRMLVLVFDNRYSKLRGKTVAYIVGTEKSTSFAETTGESSISGAGGYAVSGPAVPVAPEPASAPASVAATNVATQAPVAAPPPTSQVPLDSSTLTSASAASSPVESSSEPPRAIV